MNTILHVIDTTGPGGAETVFIDLITGLPKDKFNAVVLLRGKGWVYNTLLQKGIEPILLDAKGSFNWRYLLKLLKLVKQYDIDLIQSHLLGSNIYCSLAGALSGKPVVSTFHGAVDIGENERFKWLKFMIINFGSKMIISVSDKLRKDIISRTPIFPKKINVIHNGIITNNFQVARKKDIRSQLKLPKNEPLIGCLGNIRPAKGYDTLLKAAHLLQKQGKNLQFVIAGQGDNSLHKKLLTMRADYGLENSFHFYGFVDDPAEFLANIDIFLLSSYSEGFSISTIQAMASGLPVIATKSGGPEEIINHYNTGWLVEPDNKVAIAEAVIALTSKQSLCEKLAKNGEKHVRNTFDIAKMLSSYEDIYARLLPSS